jgi:hypothetical protein
VTAYWMFKPLSQESAFDDIVKGVQGIAHIASPVHIGPGSADGEHFCQDAARDHAPHKRINFRNNSTCCQRYHRDTQECD